MKILLQIAWYCILAILIIGCAAPVSHPVARPAISENVPSEKSAPRPANRRSGELQQVNFEDGIDEREAKIIAWIYFNYVYGSCGMLGPRKDFGISWYFPAWVGYGGAGKPGIFVEKDECLISCASGPRITDPSQLKDPKDPIWSHTKWYDPRK